MNRDINKIPEGLFRKSEIIARTQKPEKAHYRVDTRPFKTIFYIILLIAILYYVLFGSFFKIKRIDMDGVKSQDVAVYVNQTLLGKNIIFFRPGAYLKTVSKKFPILEQASIVRGLPNTIKFVASERNQVLVWCSSSCWNIDSNGYAYEQVPRPTDRVVLNDESNLSIEDSQQVTSPQFIVFFLSAIDRMKQMNINTTQAKIEQTTFKVSFQTSDGYWVVLDSTTSLDNQLAALQQVLDKNRADVHEYIDLRVEGLAYLK